MENEISTNFYQLYMAFVLHVNVLNYTLWYTLYLLVKQVIFFLKIKRLKIPNSVWGKQVLKGRLESTAT